MCFSSFISLQERNVVTVVSESDSFHGSIILVVEIITQSVRYQCKASF